MSWAEALSIASTEMRGFVIFYDPVALWSISGSCHLPHAAKKKKVFSSSAHKPINLLDPIDLCMQQGVQVDNSFQITYINGE